MENRVIKVITINDSIIFVITQKDGLFSWDISQGEWLSYWEKQAQKDKRLYLFSLSYTPISCEMFVNDPINDTVGTSTGSFDTIDDVLKYYEIL